MPAKTRTPMPASNLIIVYDDGHTDVVSMRHVSAVLIQPPAVSLFDANECAPRDGEHTPQTIAETVVCSICDDDVEPGQAEACDPTQTSLNDFDSEGKIMCVCKNNIGQTKEECDYCSCCYASGNGVRCDCMPKWKPWADVLDDLDPDSVQTRPSNNPHGAGKNHKTRRDRCGNCGVEGHKRPTCPITTTRCCGNCGFKGHDSRNCPVEVVE